MESGANGELPQELKQSLQHHMDQVRDKIAKRAIEIFKQDEQATQQITVIHLSEAIKEYAPGRQVPLAVPTQRSRLESLSSVPIISTILAVVFGGLGLLAILSGTADKIGGQAYLDISKIFAGAIVGSASVAASTAFRGSRGSV
jgi:hypothetical protein